MAAGKPKKKRSAPTLAKVDVMVLDYLMPDGHGVDLLQTMARESALQKPRIIMCSSLIDPANPAWKALCSRLPFGLQELIQGYVGKPYTFEEIDPVMHAILEIKTGDY